jgi:hypothetical protein
MRARWLQSLHTRFCSDAGARPQSGHVSGHVCERDMVFGVQGKIARVDANHTQACLCQ